MHRRIRWRAYPVSLADAASAPCRKFGAGLPALVVRGIISGMRTSSLLVVACLFGLASDCLAGERADKRVYDYEMTSVPKVGGGDADINSQGGRSTQVHIKVSNIRLDNDGRAILVEVLYSVKEVWKNYTHLQRKATVRVDLPNNWKVKKLADDVTELDHSEAIEGKEHGWVDISNNTGGTCVEEAQVKIDGPGDDDKGNARLKIKLVIPVVVETPD